LISDTKLVTLTINILLTHYFKVLQKLTKHDSIKAELVYYYVSITEQHVKNLTYKGWLNSFITLCNVKPRHLHITAVIYLIFVYLFINTDTHSNKQQKAEL